FTRPPLGSEPASTFIGGVSTELRFRPAWITRALAKLPGIHTDAPSFLNVSAEIAMSRPGPNPAGQAYIEEFEGEAGRFLSLAEHRWHRGRGPTAARVEFLELWGWEDNHRVAKAANTALLLDFGSVFEDALAFVPETLTVTPQGDTVYSGDRAAGLGRLDTERDPLTHSWSATQDDE